MYDLSNWSEYLNHIDNSLGGARPEPFESTVESALGVISMWIPPIDGRLHDLPSRVTGILSQPDTQPGVVDLDVAAKALSEKTRLTPATAFEFLLTVLRATDEGLDDEGRKHFRRNLPGDLVDSFARAPAHRGKHAAGRGRTLADGKPGAKRNVAEHDVAEEDSVATSDDPHAETRLSSSRGYGQERQKRTLADGKPGSSRPLHDEKS